MAQVCDGLKELMTALGPAVMGSSNSNALWTAADRYGSALGKIIEYAYMDEAAEQSFMPVTKAVRSELVEIAKDVCVACASVVRPAKDIAGRCSDSKLQDALLIGSRSISLAATQLSSCATVVAPTVRNMLCLDQLLLASQLLSKALQSISYTAAQACKDQPTISHFRGELAQVTAGLARLEQRAHASAVQNELTSRYSGTCSAITTSTAGLTKVRGDISKMVAYATDIAKSVSTLVAKVKVDASNEKDLATGKRLQWMARTMTDASAALVTAAKQAASATTDTTKQDELLRVAQAISGMALGKL